jgi:hypothetical protein
VLRSLERHVHLQDVAGRREEHPLPVGQDHRLEDVDHLREVGHTYTLGVTMEDLEGQRSDQRVAQRVLLVEEAGVATRLGVVPGAPLVDEESDALLGVVTVHDRRVAGDHGRPWRRL